MGPPRYRLYTFYTHPIYLLYTPYILCTHFYIPLLYPLYNLYIHPIYTLYTPYIPPRVGKCCGAIRGICCCDQRTVMWSDQTSLLLRSEERDVIRPQECAAANRGAEPPVCC